MSLIPNQLFYCKNKDTYPPFKNGLYLEEYFLKYMNDNNIQTKRKYIPALWTNFQIEGWFNSKQNEMQNALDIWINNNPSSQGYFTIFQYDDGPKLKLPKNTIIYGACSGDIPIPLIYEDKNNILLNIPIKSFSEKNILCSFIGNITSNTLSPNVREMMFNKFQHNSNFKMINAGGWTPIVNKNNQDTFITTTLNSKFAFAPRGYGRSSFRFFECLKLRTIPIYVWNDINWLPFQDKIDYNKLCIVCQVYNLDTLEKTLNSITEIEYTQMLEYYQTIKHFFTLEGMSKEIIQLNY